MNAELRHGRKARGTNLTDDSRDPAAIDCDSAAVAAVPLVGGTAADSCTADSEFTRTAACRTDNTAVNDNAAAVE